MENSFALGICGTPYLCYSIAMLGIVIGITLKAFILEGFHQWSLRKHGRGSSQQRGTEQPAKARPVLYPTAQLDSHIRTIEQRCR